MHALLELVALYFPDTHAMQPLVLGLLLASPPYPAAQILQLLGLADPIAAVEYPAAHAVHPAEFAVVTAP